MTSTQLQSLVISSAASLVYGSFFCSAVISSAAFQAGVAATAGERLKMSSIWTLLTNVEVILFHLCVRLLVYGLHLPCQLCLPLLSDLQLLPCRTARRQLLQQLSATLWCYNVKIILWQYALISEDDSFLVYK